MPTPATIIYPELNGEPYFVGIQFQNTDGILRRAVCYQMGYGPGEISVGWLLQTSVLQLSGEYVWETSSASTPPLTVSNYSYRRLSDMAVVPASEALAPDGSLKPGYTTEYQFFRMFFGLDNNQPKGIFWFMADALVRKINATYDLDLVLA